MLVTMKGKFLTLKLTEPHTVTGVIQTEAESSKEASRTARFVKPVTDFLKRFRAVVARRPWLDIAYKITLGAIGTVVILAGIAMLVLPGPGWLTIFLGLAILGTEFAWARRILVWLRSKVTMAADRWRRYRAAKKADKQQS